MQIDGIEVDDEKVADAVRRCVTVMMMVTKYRQKNPMAIRMSTPLSQFLDDVEKTLRGEDVA